MPRTTPLQKPELSLQLKEKLTCCFLWSDSSSSPSSGLFTLILAAIFPSNSTDRFTLSKLLAVALR